MVFKVMGHEGLIEWWANSFLLSVEITDNI